MRRPRSLRPRPRASGTGRTRARDGFVRPAPASRALQRLELAASLEHGHDAGLGIELRLDRAVLVLPGDLANPAARAVARRRARRARHRDRRRPRRRSAASPGSAETSARRAAAHARPPARPARGPRPLERERKPRIGGDLDRRPGGTRAGSKRSERCAARPGAARIGDCLNRIAASGRPPPARRPGWPDAARAGASSSGGFSPARRRARSRPARSVERGPQRVVQRLQTDLVARGHRPAGADEPRARATLLRRRRSGARPARSPRTAAVTSGWRRSARCGRRERPLAAAATRAPRAARARSRRSRPRRRGGARRACPRGRRASPRAPRAPSGRPAPPRRVARDGASGIGCAARRTTMRAAPPRPTVTSPSKSSGRSGIGLGRGYDTSASGSPGSSRKSSRSGSSRIGRSWTRFATSVRRRWFGGSRRSASGTVTRVPSRSMPKVRLDRRASPARRARG